MNSILSSSVKSFKESVTFLDEIFEHDLLRESTFNPFKLQSILMREYNEFIKVFSKNKIEGLVRVLSEELCELILPTILDNGNNFLSGMAIRNKSLGLSESQGNLREKFSILSQSRYINTALPRSQPGYGFIAYPGYMFVNSSDLIARFPKTPERYFKYAYPVIYEIEGLKQHKNGTSIPGWMAFFFIKPKTMLQQVELVQKKTLEAVKAIEKLNGKIIGLGGLSASLTRGGLLLASKTSSKITTGHAYTIANISNTLRKASLMTSLPLDRSIIAIVGAAGSVGSGTSIMCSELGVKKLILIDKRPLESTISKIRKISDVPVVIGDFKKDISEAHVVLVATSDPNQIFDSVDLQSGTIIIDDSQPKNVEEELMSQRNDIIVLEGGAVRLSSTDTFKISPAYGPKLKPFHWGLINQFMTGKNEVPSCLAEVMAWSSLNERREEYSIGVADPQLAGYLNRKCVSMGFAPARLQCFGKNITEERFSRIREINQGRFS